MHRALVIGYGSIGARHVRVLSQLGCAPAVVSRRAVDCSPRYPTLADALKAEVPDYVVIANSTHEHHGTILALAEAEYRGRVLVEKPLFDAEYPVPPHAFSAAFVGYNLRCHPVLRRLRALLKDEVVAAAQVYVGQYLPDWRPGVDYRHSYSARRCEGGGVLRDLSHELDYVSWLFGGWTRLASLGGRFGGLEMDADDVFAVLLETPRCPVVTIQMNCLDRRSRREILVNTRKRTFRADLVAGILQIDSGPAVAETVPRDVTFLAQHRAVLDGPPDDLATFEDGLNVLAAIAAAERAVRDGCWIGNGVTGRASGGGRPSSGG